MLVCTCTIHLGIQWTRIWCSRAYAQHQHGRIQGICPSLPMIFSCVLEVLAQHKCKYSCALELLSKHKILISHVLQSSSLNTEHHLPMCSRTPRSTQIINHSSAQEISTQHKTSHQSYALGSTPNTNKHIYHQQLAYAQYTKKIIMFIYSGVFDPV